MANIEIRDGDAVEKYLKATGAGTSGDPFVPEHLDSNSASQLTALQAIQAAVEILDNIVSGSEAQVDVVAALPAGDNNIGNVDIASALPAGTNNIGDVDLASPLPAGTNNIGDVDVTSIAAGSNLIGKVDIAPSGTVARQAVNISASGNLIAAGTNKIKVLGMFLMADADLTVDITDGNGGASLIPSVPLATDGNGFVLPPSTPGYHWIETTAATALYAAITGTGNLTGVIVYIDEA